MSRQQLVCPDCGEGRFSWVVEGVRFGRVENRNGIRVPVSSQSVDVTDRDIDENGVFCTGCDEFKEMNELKSEVEVTDDE